MGKARETNENEIVLFVMKLATQTYRLPSATGFICDIDPDAARKLLGARDKRQRSINKGRVAIYARDMAAGRWHSMGQPVVLSTDGTLIDGQHRLTAAAESDFMWKGVKIEIGAREIVQGCDVGYGRSTQGQLRFVLGATPDVPNTVIAAIKAEARDFAGHLHNLSKAEEIEMVRRCTHVEWLSDLQRAAAHQRIASSGMIGAALRAVKVAPEDAHDFFGAVCRRNPQVRGKYSAAANLLINRLSDMRGKGGGQIVREAAVVSLSAFNAWRVGREPKLIRYAPSYEIPEVG